MDNIEYVNKQKMFRSDCIDDLHFAYSVRALFPCCSSYNNMISCSTEANEYTIFILSIGTDRSDQKVLVRSDGTELKRHFTSTYSLPLIQ